MLDNPILNLSNDIPFAKQTETQFKGFHFINVKLFKRTLLQTSKGTNDISIVIKSVLCVDNLGNTVQKYHAFISY